MEVIIKIKIVGNRISNKTIEIKTETITDIDSTTIKRVKNNRPAYRARYTSRFDIQLRPLVTQRSRVKVSVEQ